MILLVTLSGIVALLALHGVFYRRNAERRHPPAGSFATVNDLKMHYLDVNPDAEGRPIVLIHGASCNLLDMKTAFAALPGNRRLILIDRPGFGYSSRGQNSALLSDQAACIAALLDGLNVEHPILIAQSFGTAVALSYALEHADNISGLLLLAPVSHRWPGGVDWYNHVALTPVVGTMFRHCLIPAYGVLFGRSIVNAAFWPGEAPATYFDDAALPLVFRPQTFKSNAEDLMALYDQFERMEDRYQEIRVPLRMLSGTHDAVVLSTIHGLSLERKVSGATMRYLPYAGHPLHHMAFSDIVAELELLEADIDQSSS